MRHAEIKRVRVIDGNPQKGVTVFAKLANGAPVEMVVADLTQAAKCMEFQYSSIAIDDSGAMRLIEKPGTITKRGEPRMTFHKTTTAQSATKATAIDAMTIAEAMMRTLRADPNFRELDSDKQADVLAAAAAAAIRALRAAGIDVDDVVTGQTDENDRSLNPRNAGDQSGHQGAYGAKSATPDELEKLLATVSLSPLEKLVAFGADLGKTVTKVNAERSGDIAKVLEGRLAQPRMSAAGGSDSLLKRDDYYSGSPTGRRQGDIVSDLTDAVAKAHGSGELLDFSAAHGGGATRMHVNRMLADVYEPQREELVKAINARGRVGTELNKLLH